MPVLNCDCSLETGLYWSDVGPRITVPLAFLFWIIKANIKLSLRVGGPILQNFRQLKIQTAESVVQAPCEIAQNMVKDIANYGSA